MKKKLFLLVAFVMLFTVMFTGLTKVNAATVSYRATGALDEAAMAEGYVVYNDFAYADRFVIEFGEGLEITEANGMLNFKCYLENVYRANLYVRTSDGNETNVKWFIGAADQTDSRIVQKMDENGIYEYHGNLAEAKESPVTLKGTTVTALLLEFYVNAGTTGNFQLLGVEFDADGSYSDFRGLYGAENTPDEPTPVPPTINPDPAGDLLLSDITTEAEATITKGENGEQVVEYSVKPGWATFNIVVENYTSDLTTLEIAFTPSEATKICFEINGQIDWEIGHREYAGSTLHTFKCDVTELALPSTFTIAMYIDAEDDVVVESAKSIAFHSIVFKGAEVGPEIPDDGTLKFSPLQTTANASIVSGANGEQVVTYSVKPGWSTFNTEVKNYDANLSVLEVKFTPSETVKIAFEINGQIDWGIGHKEYAGGKEQTFKYDVTALALPADFTIAMYIDAEDDVVVESEKTITFHSFTFKTPDPLPEGMWLSEPNPSSMSCLEGENGWDIKYNNDTASWRNVAITINNHDVNYDIIRIKVELIEGTNLGIRLYWTDANGFPKYADIRNHHSTDGVAESTGLHDLVFHVGAFGAQGLVLDKMELYFDPATAYTTNTGDVVAKLVSYELLKSSELELGELEFSVNNTTADYTGEPVALDIVCALENVKFRVEHAKIVEGIEEVVWFDGIPTDAGQYQIRVTYVGSLEYGYKSVEAQLVINKVKAPVKADAVTYDAQTRVVTVLAGYEASTDEEFAAGSEVLDGDVVPYGTVIYFRHAGNNNYTPSDVTSVEVIRPVEPEPTPTPVPTPPTGDPEPDPQPTPTPNEGEKEEKKGCGGSVVGSVFAVVTLLGVVAVCKKRKED